MCEVATKYCKECRKDKPLTEFNFYKCRDKYYPQTYCKKCHSELNKANKGKKRKETLAYHSSYNKLYREKNRDKLRIAGREYRESNKDSINEKKRKSYRKRTLKKYAAIAVSIALRKAG